ncbi:adenylate/guanylate cyclase domain-containing protein [Candidatus Riflebacteria bacterium]
MGLSLKRKIIRSLYRKRISIDELLFKKVSIEKLIRAFTGIIDENYFFEGPDEEHFVNFLVEVLNFIHESSESELSLETESYIKKLQHELEAYSTKGVLDLILSDGEVEKASEARVDTILFGDIRGFTKMSQNLEPEKVVKILNRYLNLMYDLIRRNSGVVDKFIGDGVMALFSDPNLSLKENAENAVYAAIDMQNRFRQFKTVLGQVEEAAAHIGLGIGVNTGQMIIGNIGSERRKDYTAIGAEVNFAANIMGKAHAGEILLGKETYKHLADTEIEANKIIINLTHKRLQQDFEVYKVKY